MRIVVIWAIATVALSACCMGGGSHAVVGTVSNRQPDARFVTDDEPLLVMATEGLLLLRMNGTDRRLLVPASSFASYGHSAEVLDHDPSWNVISMEAGGEPYLVRLDPLELTPLAPGATLGNALFSPDGRQLAVAAIWHGRTELIVVDLAEGGALESTRRVELGDEYLQIDGWSDDGRIRMHEYATASEHCWVADPLSLERQTVACDAGSVSTVAAPAARCTEVGIAETRARTSVSVADAIILHEPSGGERPLVVVDGWRQGVSGFDSTSAPSVQGFRFGTSCEYGVFLYDQVAYVVEIATGRTAALTTAYAVYRLAPVSTPPD
jgi:hypothetical protein